MSESEVMSSMSRGHDIQTNSKFASSVIDDLENECYMKREWSDCFKSEVKSKIEEFSNWFNSTARLYLLRCDPADSEMYVYLLLNLKKKLKFAISEINKSVSNQRQTFTCEVCGDNIDVQPWQNAWTTIQTHSHLEESYCQAFDSSCSVSSDNVVENGESTTTNGSVIDDLSEDLSQLVLDEPPRPQETSLNDFKFNFVVTYDQRVEEALYPEPLILAARKRDNLSEYTVQRCGVGRGVCLLCPCSLMSKGRVYKITPFVIKNHVSGQRHLKFASTAVNTSALRQYHDFWRSQEPIYQAHQVHFVPEVGGASLSRCLLCLEFVKYGAVVDHIKDKTHKTKVLKIFNSPEGKVNDFYLLDMQVEVYDIVVNHARKEEKKKSEANGAGQPKCEFVQIVVEADGLNLPPRYKDHLKFFTGGSESVTCNICKISFANDAVVMRSHVANTQHKQLSGITPIKYSYFCEICNIHIKDEDAWQEHFIKGPNRHDSLSQIRRAKVCEYECKTCLTVLFGDNLSLSRHKSSRGGRPGRAKEVKLPFSVKRLFKSNAFIEDEAQKLQVEAEQVLHCQERMNECCGDLEDTLAFYYPNCKAYPFGSRISGLGNNKSDLDVFMDTGDMYLGERNQDPVSQEQFVKKVSKAIKSNKDDFSYVVSIPSARTPIVKMHHIYTELDCDISFRHGLGVENTKFLRFCIDLQPITQPFILLLKKWSDHCRLNEHITNYGLALMAVFFLQTGGYLLSVKTIRDYNPTQSLVIDGWDTINYTVPLETMREYVKPYTSTVKQLLRDFFFYFSKFDYANNVVCPLLGNTIPKLWFNDKPNGESLPVEMKSYVLRIQSENGEQFRGLTPFCIQDPFDLSHNLTKACHHGTISKLKAFCTLTYEFLDAIQ